VHIEAADSRIYLALYQDNVGKSISSTLQSEANANLSSSTKDSPSEISTFLTELSNSAQLDTLTAHVWTALGDSPSATAKFAGVASILNEPISFAVSVSGISDWATTVTFDIVQFTQKHLSKLKFLHTSNTRRMLSHTINGPVQGGMRISSVGSESRIQIGQLRFSGMYGPLLTRATWPSNVSGGLQALDTIHPLFFTLAGVEVHANIVASHGPAGSALLVQIESSSNLTLAQILREVVNFDQCAASQTYSSRSLFCDLMDMALGISLGPFNINAMMSSGDGYSLDIIINDLTMWSLPPLGVRLRAQKEASGSTQWGVTVQIDSLDFGGMMRRINGLKINGLHLCDAPLFAPFW
jgi:hypothetical protein